MQGGWLLATAVGNKLLVVGTILWDKVALSTLWLVFIVCCLVSATFIFSIIKRLEKAGKSLFASFLSLCSSVNWGCIEHLFNNQVN
jgi:hypothetical protein